MKYREALERSINFPTFSTAGQHFCDYHHCCDCCDCCCGCGGCGDGFEAQGQTGHMWPESAGELKPLQKANRTNGGPAGGFATAGRSGYRIT